MDYSVEKVQEVISKLRATPRDYLLQAYMDVMGPQLQNCQILLNNSVRLNNIIFNNVKVICKEIVCNIFGRKIDYITHEKLAGAHFVSVLVSDNLCGVTTLMLQYFDTRRGICQILYDYVNNMQINTILSEAGLMGKISGYCDGCPYPINLESPNDKFKSLCILNNRSPIYYLPSQDYFLDHLFNIIVSYLQDHDTGAVLITLGNFLTCTHCLHSGSKHTVLRKEFHKWNSQKGRGKQILSSKFAMCVASDMDSIKDLLSQFDAIPQTLRGVFGNAFNRFFLVFLVHLYQTLASTAPLKNNSALSYYSQLKCTVEKLKGCVDKLYKPTEATDQIKQDVDGLLKKGVITPEEAKKHEKNLIDLVDMELDRLYIRALAYIKPIIENLQDLELFSWVLLEDPSFSVLTQYWETIHMCFHYIYRQSRDECAEECVQLQSEVAQLSEAFSLPGDRGGFDTVDQMWAQVITGLDQFPSVFAKILEFVFSLPTSLGPLLPVSADALVPSGNPLSSRYENTVNRIKFNGYFTYENDAELLEAFAGNLEEIEDIIKSKQITLLVE